MPELPEVEAAAVRLRSAIRGRRIIVARVLHPALRRRLSRGDMARLRGARIDRVDRRGKYQLLHLDTGDTLIAHFRMSGGWHISAEPERLPSHARAVLEMEDGTRVVLVDPRALSSLEVAPTSALPLPPLGPDPLTPGFTARALGKALARRLGPIKPVLLDQSIIAGVGNIYAAEALWRARIHPAAPASQLDRAELRAVAAGIRHVMRGALRRAGRYFSAFENDQEMPRFAVYGRAGQPCRRCGTAITRITQGGRSTYFCPRCQPRCRTKSIARQSNRH
ncbi:MAG TPA: bifunctional DNA-formamidopyrimidine glycosylase/DNA-(apurinic or apyrimidinic site) lyase [Gemmatimonadaceae bacterium]|nr:bifunctional DNA-formamidopyrimidine glycosylase/DNA-(apurinic or apyrimidinic site) lyase [Gemmatimonadaceae bacterium]